MYITTFHIARLCVAAMSRESIVIEIYRALSYIRHAITWWWPALSNRTSASSAKSLSFLDRLSSHCRHWSRHHDTFGATKGNWETVAEPSSTVLSSLTTAQTRISKMHAPVGKPKQTSLASSHFVAGITPSETPHTPSSNRCDHHGCHVLLLAAYRDLGRHSGFRRVCHPDGGYDPPARHRLAQQLELMCCLVDRYVCALQGL